MRTILLVLLISCSKFVFAQYSTHDSTAAADRQVEVYLNKAKQKNKAGWILAGTGTSFVVTGGIIGMSDLAKEIGDIFEPDENSNNRIKLSEFFAITGLVMIAGSVPFFIQGSKYKKKARLVIGQSSLPIPNGTFGGGVQRLPGLQIASKQVHVGIAITL